MELEKMILDTPLASSRGEGRVRGAAAKERQTMQIKLGETPAIMQRAWAGIVASGSATLEAAYFRMPFVLVYKVAWPTYLAARLVVTVKYLGMPNVLANKEVVPEFIQHTAKPPAIADAVQPLIENARAREQMISEFDSIMGKLGRGRAGEKAAQVIIGETKEGRSSDRPGGLEAAAP
jgi:lipid-A-disaccharide synthase